VDILLAQQQFLGLLQCIGDNYAMTRNILYEYIVPTPQVEYQFTSKDLMEGACLLADYGLFFLKPSPLRFCIVAPILRELVILKCYRPSHDPPILPVEDLHKLLDQPAELIKFCLKFFDFEILGSAETLNKTTKFTSEHTFQAEIYITIRRMFDKLVGSPKKWKAFLEAKSMDPFSGTKRTDLLIRNNKKILYEFKCCRDWRSLKGKELMADMAQVVQYTKMHNATLAVLVNFCNFHPLLQESIVLDSPQIEVVDGIPVHIIQVYFKSDWTFKVYTQITHYIDDSVCIGDLPTDRMMD